jgi:hypothetical protein
MLAKHGITLPVNMQGLTEDQIHDLKLQDDYADKCVPMDGYVDDDDITGKRNGRGTLDTLYCTDLSMLVLFDLSSAYRTDEIHFGTNDSRSKR